MSAKSPARVRSFDTYNWKLGDNAPEVSFTPARNNVCFTRGAKGSADGGTLPPPPPPLVLSGPAASLSPY